MHLTILTPEQKVFDGEIISVTLPGSHEKGAFQILSKHAPIVSSLTPGKLVVKKVDGEILNFQVRSGFVEANNNEISVLVEAVNGKYTPDDID